MHIKTKTTIDGVAYYVCYSYSGTDPIVHWVSKTPQGFNRLNELDDATKLTIKLNLSLLID